MIVLHKSTELPSIDINDAGRTVVFNVAEYSAATLQAIQETGSWGSTTLTIERSNDGYIFVALESATTLTAAGMTAKLDVTGFKFLRARVSTPAGSAATARLVLVAKAER